MLEVNTTIQTRGIISRLRLIKKALFERKGEVERELEQGNDVGGQADVGFYDTDAEESLAMALGKDVGRGSHKEGLVFKKPLDL